MEDRKFLGRKDGETKITFTDIQYIMMQKVFDVRCDDINDKFPRSITALDNTLAGIKDEIYEAQLRVLDLKYDVIKIAQGKAVADALYYDEKHQILSSLITRHAQGQLQIREYLKQSEVVRQLVYNLSYSIGQNILIVGAQGSGKSYSAISIGVHAMKEQGKDFCVRTHVVFSVEQFFELYNNKSLTPAGSVIIFDDSAVAMYSKSSMSTINKIFSSISQTVRHRGLLIIFTCPDESDLDKTVRKQLHWKLETKRIDRANKICWLKPFVLEVKNGEIYTKYPINDDKNQVTELRIEKLDDSYANAYEQIARDAKEAMAKDSEQRVMQYNEEKEYLKTKVPMSETPEYKAFKQLKDEGLELKEIAIRLNKSPKTVTKYHKLYRAKAYDTPDTQSAYVDTCPEGGGPMPPHQND